MTSIAGLKLINAESNVTFASEKSSVVYNIQPCVSAPHFNVIVKSYTDQMIRS
jgi:hypothetical protein